VWALGKTLWVLLADAELPQPGTHRAAEAAHALRDRITFTFAAELDLLLERATQIDPTRRVSMEEMARELKACAVPPPEAQPNASLAELSARAAALTPRGGRASRCAKSAKTGKPGVGGTGADRRRHGD
jgi:hypothetical protein